MNKKKGDINFRLFESEVQKLKKNKLPADFSIKEVKEGFAYGYCTISNTNKIVILWTTDGKAYIGKIGDTKEGMIYNEDNDQIELVPFQTFGRTKDYDIKKWEE